MRGARASEVGRAILALASTTANGKHSKIVPSLEGVPVSTARTDIDVVVTEQGVASLRGLDLEARRRALIGVAHPAFREMLERAAMERSEEHTSELQSLMRISYAVFCLKKKKLKKHQ